MGPPGRDEGGIECLRPGGGTMTAERTKKKVGRVYGTTASPLGRSTLLPPITASGCPEAPPTPSPPPWLVPGQTYQGQGAAGGSLVMILAEAPPAAVSPQRTYGGFKLCMQVPWHTHDLAEATGPPPLMRGFPVMSHTRGSDPE